MLQGLPARLQILKQAFRQIRLWGVEAQNRMRNASVLLITLRGLATEVAKNLVLAGVGSLTIWDGEDVCEQDLGSGYFYRKTDVGRNRAQAARDRIQALNPRVHVFASRDQGLHSNFAPFDVVCATDIPTNKATQINEQCRQQGTRFYSAAALGLGGFIFADLLAHEYIVERAEVGTAADPEPTKTTHRRHQVFVPLERALTETWTDEKKLKPKAVRKMIPLIEVLAFLRLQSQERTFISPDDLMAAMQSLMAQKEMDLSLLDAERLSFFARSYQYEFAPTCAVLGGILAQDILNALGRKAAPLVNFFVLDAITNAGDIYALGGVERTV